MGQAWAGTAIEGTACFRACLATVFTLRIGTARSKRFLGFSGPNPFGTTMGRLGPGPDRPSPIPSTRCGATSVAGQEYICNEKNHKVGFKMAPDDDQMQGSSDGQ
jgi:hypothetical protein